MQELAGGKSGPSGLRRSSERSDSAADARTEKTSSHTSGEGHYDTLALKLGNSGTAYVSLEKFCSNAVTASFKMLNRGHI